MMNCLITTTPNTPASGTDHCPGIRAGLSGPMGGEYGHIVAQAIRTSSLPIFNNVYVPDARLNSSVDRRLNNLSI